MLMILALVLYFQASKAVKVFNSIKEKRMFFLLALTGWSRTGPRPGPAPFHSPHVSSLFHADI